MMKVNLSKHFVKDSKKLYKKYTSLATDVVKLIGELKENPTMGIPIGK